MLNVGRMNFKRYLVIATAMLALDWTLGALQTAHIIPLWSFLLLNFPFGLPFVWLESHWASTHYEFAGQYFGEYWSFAALFFAIFAQAWLYTVLYGRWRGGTRKAIA